MREIYVDESSQTKHRYLLLGGLVANLEDRTRFERLLQSARGVELPSGELGWVKVSRAKLEAYRRFARVFFVDHDCKPIQFHCLVVDTHRIDDRTYNAGSRSAGFNKEVYQLLLKCGRLYPSENFHAYLDQRSTPIPIEELRRIVNWGMMKKWPHRDWPVRRMHYRDSASCLTLQAVDLMLGALGFRLNGHRDKPDASPAKCELSDYILSLAGVSDVMRDTAISGKFTVWHRQLKVAVRGK